MANFWLQNTDNNRSHEDSRTQIEEIKKRLSSKVDFSTVEPEVPKPKKEIKKATPKPPSVPKVPKENKPVAFERVPVAKTLKKNKNKEVIASNESVKKLEPINVTNPRYDNQLLIFSKPKEQKQKVEKKQEEIPEMPLVPPGYEEKFPALNKSKSKKKLKEETKVAEKAKPIFKKEETKVIFYVHN